MADSFLFDQYRLDPGDRRLERGKVPVDLNARYLDALALLVGEAGKLVSKDRFLEQVWSGVPVTDEALTQCIKTLRRQLGDNAASPRFIETVPKYGYRFIAPVERIAAGTPAEPPEAPVVAPSAAPIARAGGLRQLFLLGGAGTLGAGAAGIAGGLFYGFAGASLPLAPGVGALSVLLVLLCLTLFVALLGGAGVAFGIAAAGLAPGRHLQLHRSVLGGALGGFVVGALVKLVGLDAFNLLFGQSLGDITGAGEGALLGAAVGLGAWVGGRGAEAPPLRRSIGAAAFAGGGAGLLIPLLGGRMMGGSLDLLARQFPQSRLRLDGLGALFGEPGFGPLSQAVTGGLEGALFAGSLVAAMILARRSLASARSGKAAPPLRS